MKNQVDAAKLLIDSHVYIWLLFEQQMVTEKCRQVVEGADVVYVSVASLWELVLKHNKGLLKYQPGDIAIGRDKMGVALLPISEQHILATSRTELPHKDPFDTMLIAQAKQEGLTLLTADQQLLGSQYPTIDVRP